MSDLKSKENCTGPYPALFRFTYSHEVPVRIPDGFGDSEFSHMREVEGQYDVVALNEGFAVEAFKMDRPASIYHRRSGPEFVCYVDAAVGVSKNYGGHFS